MAKRSKAYEAAAAKIDAEKFYAPFEAVTLAKDTNPSKFDATVEVAFRLGVDPRKADQMSAGPSTCRTAPVRSPASSFSQRATGQRLQSQPAPTSLVPMT